jgi:hypothetical protein
MTKQQRAVAQAESDLFGARLLSIDNFMVRGWLSLHQPEKQEYAGVNTTRMLLRVPVLLWLHTTTLPVPQPTNQLAVDGKQYRIEQVLQNDPVYHLVLTRNN